MPPQGKHPRSLRAHTHPSGWRRRRFPPPRRTAVVAAPAPAPAAVASAAPRAAAAPSSKVVVAHASARCAPKGLYVHPALRRLPRTHGRAVVACSPVFCGGRADLHAVQRLARELVEEVVALVGALRRGATVATVGRAIARLLGQVLLVESLERLLKVKLLLRDDDHGHGGSRAMGERVAAAAAAAAPHGLAPNCVGGGGAAAPQPATAGAASRAGCGSAPCDCTAGSASGGGDTTLTGVSTVSSRISLALNTTYS